jgi:hypothetical protein
VEHLGKCIVYSENCDGMLCISTFSNHRKVFLGCKKQNPDSIYAIKVFVLDPLLFFVDEY